MTSDLSTAQPLHISLSAPLTLTTPQHDSFVPSLTPALAASAVRPFTAGLTTPRWVSNSDSTRRFLVIGVASTSGNELNRLLAACNGVARRFGVPELYVDDDELVSRSDGCAKSQVGKEVPDRSEAFHFSIAWTLDQQGGVSCASEVKLRGVDEAVLDAVRRIDVHFDVVKVKVGSVVTSVPLDGYGLGRGRTFFE